MMRRTLEGWKAIAAYLGRGSRAAQLWERDASLPVHRLQKRVFAYEDELDEWVRRHCSLPEPQSEIKGDAAPSEEEAPAEPQGRGVFDASAGSVESNSIDERATAEQPKVVPLVEAFDAGRPPVEPAAAPSRGRRWFLGGGALAAVVGTALAVARIARGPRKPATWRVVEKTLTVYAEDGREIWHHGFPFEINPAINSDKAVDTGRCACLFVDLDRDGDMETVFRYAPMALSGGPDQLFCFDAGGKVRWAFTPTREVVDAQNRKWTPPYLINVFTAISSRFETPRIVVSSNHFWSFPDQIAVLDSNGSVVGEFWHRGHLRRMAIGDINGDGIPEIVFAGVNDAPEYKQATALVFDAQSISGASSSPTGERYFRGFDAGTEKAEMFFPKTPLCLGQEFNTVSNLMIKAGRIVAFVAEGIHDNSPYVVYEFDSQLSVINVTLSNEARAIYRSLEAKGEIPPNSIEADEARLKREVKVLRRS